mmetsp:Transcript_65533/g.154799  ORF Transcript_65533/g.154799 Transcript_65533/m.154799 type:complete len:375 (+) Transcript_65533:2-1126(+)
MNEPFDRFSDELPEGRKKLIHTFGIVGQVKLEVVPGNPYSGLYTGADHCFIRASAAANPSSSLTPGMAFKCLRDGTYSGNIISMYELTGQGADWNFMKNQMKSWVTTGKGLFLSFGADIFEKGAQDPFHLGTDALAAGTQAGSQVSKAEFKTPEVIYFKPVLGPWSSDNHDYRLDFAAVEVGTKLYEVWGASGCDCGSTRCEQVEDCQSFSQIGDLVTTSSFIASEYGDKNLFFQHSRGVKKARSTCVYKDALADDTVVRMSGNTKAQCVASNDGSCPEIGGVLGMFGSKAESSSTGCPFMLNYLAGMSNSYAADASTTTTTTNKDKDNKGVPKAVAIGLGAAVAVLAVAVIVLSVMLMRTRRARRSDVELQGL